MPAYTLVIESEREDCRIALDLGHRLLRLRNPRARKIVNEFGMAAACRGLLPVVLGAGCGELLDFLSAEYEGPVAVVDKEEAVLAESGVCDRQYPNLDMLWIAEQDPGAVLNKLALWQAANRGRLFYALQHPAYLALEREYYLEIYKRLKASNESNFWARAKHPRFRGNPRPLLIRFNYMLEREITAAFKIAGIGFDALDVPGHASEGGGFVSLLLAKVLSFRPDFLLTVNFLGGDLGGGFSSLLEDIGLPVATWFMDNPENFLHAETVPNPGNLAVFCCDPGHPELLPRYGIKHRHYLPLATDSARFDLDGEVLELGGGHGVGFVGSSFEDKIHAGIRDLGLDPPKVRMIGDLARRFLDGGGKSLADFLDDDGAAEQSFFLGLSPENQRRFLITVYFTANRLYRLERLERLMPFKPAIVGDEALASALREFGHPFESLGKIPYYSRGLPRFYAQTRVNFACSNVQMPSAVTQRVFDVPAAGGLVVSDMRPQLVELFEPEAEAVAYGSADAIRETVERCLRDKAGALKIVNAARRRIRAEHTYAHRVREICRVMSGYFGSGANNREL